MLKKDNSTTEFEQIYLKYRNQMILVALSLLHNQDDAEDAVHEAFLGIANHMKTVGQIKNENDLRNYCLKSAKNASLNMLKAQSRREKTFFEPFPISDKDFLDSICTKCDCDELIRAIQKLDEKYRDVLYYHFVLEMTVPQVATLLGRKKATVKKQLIRGKKFLLQIIERKDGDGND
ncbi:MAG: RNA polymerase sigma factor [Candidatus Fimenecus sp.]